MEEYTLFEVGKCVFFLQFCVPPVERKIPRISIYIHIMLFSGFAKNEICISRYYASSRCISALPLDLHKCEGASFPYGKIDVGVSANNFIFRKSRNPYVLLREMQKGGDRTITGSGKSHDVLLYKGNLRFPFPAKKFSMTRQECFRKVDFGAVIMCV